MAGMKQRIEIEEAIGMVIANINKICDELTVSLEEAYGHILAHDLVAHCDVPSFARSAMDGYAVRSSDTEDASREKPTRLRVLSEILAGDAATNIYEAGTAVRIMTGGMIPAGFDAVIRQEDTDLGEDEVEIYTPARRYMNYCHAGEEIQNGTTVLNAGRRIGRTEIGLLASLGLDRVSVVRPIRAAIISTGSELAKPGDRLPAGCIYGNIRYMLAASVKSDGFEVSYAEDCTDDFEEIRSHIVKAAETADVVITTGGVSVGKRDLIAEILADIGAKILFTRINIQPGTPTIVSVYRNRIILSLSGNPYAALANFDLYFPPLSAKLTGCEALDTEVGKAVLCDPYDKVNAMRRLVRAYVDAGNVYLPTDRHMSSVFGNMNTCNCYIDIPADTHVSVGDTVSIRRMKYT